VELVKGLEPPTC